MGIHAHSHKPAVAYTNQPYEIEPDKNYGVTPPLLPGCSYQFVRVSYNPSPTQPQEMKLIYIGSNFSTGRDSFFNPADKTIMDLDIYGNSLYVHSGYIERSYNHNNTLATWNRRDANSLRYYSTNPVEFRGLPFDKRTSGVDYVSSCRQAIKENTIFSCIFLRNHVLYTYTGPIEIISCDKDDFLKNQWSHKFNHIANQSECRDATILFLPGATMTRDYLPFIDVREIKWMRTHKLNATSQTEEIAL